MRIKVEKYEFFELYKLGFVQPYISATIVLDPVPNQTVNPECFSFFDEHVDYILKSNDHAAHNDTHAAPCDCILQITSYVLQWQGIESFSKFHITEVSERGKQLRFSFDFPTHYPEGFIPAFKIASTLFLQAKTQSSFRLPVRELEPHLGYLSRQAPSGFNMPHLVHEAHRQSIPCTRLFKSAFQLGYGIHSRVFESSFSDQTSVIAVNLTRDKFETGKYLRSLGFPVVRSRLVSNSEAAIEFLSQAEGAVIIKPANLDGGEGVFGWLTTEPEVSAAFKKAKKFSSRVIIEDYVSGSDYRVHVVNGRVHGIVQRVPASVVGDGEKSIAQLINQKNSERRDATDDKQWLHPIQMGDEIERVLRKQGMTLETIPKWNTCVVLAAASNVALGGEPRQLDALEAHPDNINLCVEICRHLRLDIAGIDLIIPDIGQSWRDTGAHVCEVNSRPQMFTTFFQPLLEDALGEDGGKIPIGIVCCTFPEVVLMDLYASLGLDAYPGFALVSDGAVVVDGTFQKRSGLAFDIVRVLLRDNKISGLVVTLYDEATYKNGWPFVYCDFVIENGSTLAEHMMNSVGPVRVYHGIEEARHCLCQVCEAKSGAT